MKQWDMIQEFRLENFKSHRNTVIDMKNLTILTGINGCGKTSVVHALLLLRQSYLKGRLADGLDLNKPLCSIGIANDALYRLAANGVIAFELSLHDKRVLRFEFDASEGLTDSYIKKCHYNEMAADFAQLAKLPLFNNEFQYVSAARWGGRSSFPKETYSVETQKQISLDEGQGELVAHFLFKYGGDLIHDYTDEGIEYSTLISQVVYWERKISPNIFIDVEPGRNHDSFSIKYGFEGADADERPINNLSAENVGFGISYTLPVIVALLSATPGSLVIIENPEAHLHPAGQAELARLMTKVAANGVQIIVETHSDHIITGVQLACKSEENKKYGLTPDMVSIQYFYAKDRHASLVQTVVIESDGSLEYQPKGFFDQYEIDMRNLSK